MNTTDPKNKYVLYVGYEFEVEDNIHPLMDKAIPITKYKSKKVYSYHGEKRNTNKGLWRVERDASLHNGAEFISPPVPMEESFEMMRKFFRTIIEAKSCTSTRCGCHTNICLTYNGRILKMNENAMICNIDWRLLCSLWPDRLKTKNAYCKYINQILKDNDNSLNLKNKNEFAGTLFTHYHGFITRKPSSWNKKGMYYELRFPGGEDYHLYPEKIETTVKHFSEVLDRSRLAICRTQNKDHNRKIISYINRKANYNINIPTFNRVMESNIKNISKLKNIKCFINSNNKRSVYNLLLAMVHDIVCIKKTTESESFSFYHKKHVDNCKNFITELTKTINKENILYYICKICFIFTRETGEQTGNVLKNLQLLLGIEGVKFTIPKDEKDLHKLWLVRYLYMLPEETECVLIKSMKSNRVKSLLNKLARNNRYLEPKFCEFINHVSTEYLNNDKRNINR